MKRHQGEGEENSVKARDKLKLRRAPLIGHAFLACPEMAGDIGRQWGGCAPVPLVFLPVAGLAFLVRILLRIWPMILRIDTYVTGL